jgi:hypothetical protein
MSNSLKGDLKNLRRESVAKRSELFRQPFFCQFPVIILATGHYPRDNNFDITEVFDVDYIAQKEVGNSWVNIHREKSGDPRILLHVRQLSVGISTEFIAELANIVKEFRGE